MNQEIKTVIIPLAGLGTRFLPLSKVISKEFFPIVDKPVIQYIIQEAKDSGIAEVVFIINSSQKMILSYFKKSEKLEKELTKKNKEGLLKELKDFEAIFDGVTVHFIIQKKPLGDGHAILQAAKFAEKGPVGVLFADDIVDSESPALAQLIEIYKTCDSPVMALKKLPKEKLSAYGVVGIEKIASRLYKVKDIAEKPSPEEILSDLVVVGKYVLTPEVFEYLKKAKPSKRGEIILADTFRTMLNDGKVLYGFEFKGEWLECGDKEKWLKSFMYFSMRDPRYGAMLKKYLKEIS